MKQCSKCNLTKPLDAFSKHPHTRDRRRHECKSCLRTYHKQIRFRTGRDSARVYEFKRRYGITLEQFNAMLQEQNGCCAICDRHITELGEGRWKTLGVDHDHDTGKVRGLLCHVCNSGLGMFREDTRLLERAAKYLRLYKKGD